MLLSSPVETSVEFDEVLAKLEKIASRLHQCNSLDTLLNWGVEQTRQLFESDRALIYQFIDGGDGAVTAESVASEYHSIRDQLIYDPCFEINWGEKFQRGAITAISDVEQAALDTCYVELMRRLQVRANLVSPILVHPSSAAPASHPDLWGLLIIHHCRAPYPWRTLHRRVIKHLSTQIGLAIQHLALSQRSDRNDADNTQWKAVLEVAACGSWDWNLQTDEVIWSPQWKALLGYTEEAIDHSLAAWEALIHPADRERAERAIDQHLNQQTSVYRCEYRLLANDGHWRWVLSQGRVSDRRAGNEPIRFIGLTVDISDRKQQEFALEQQAQRELALNQVVEAIRRYLDLDQIFAVAAEQIARCIDCRVRISQYLSQAACWRPVAVYGGQYGWEGEQRATIWADIPDLDNPIAAQLKRLEIVQIDDTAQIESADLVNRPIAQQFPGQWLLVPIAINQAAWGAVSLTRPMGGTWRPAEIDLIQRMAEQLATAIYHASLHQQIRLAHERDALVLQSINEGIWDWDPITNLVCVSDQYWEILGYDPDTETATALQNELQRLHPDDRDAFLAAIETHFASGERFYQEIRIQRRQGDYIWVRTRGTAIRNAQGHPVRMLGSIENISDRKSLERALQHSRDRLSTVLASSYACIANFRLYPDGTIIHDYFSPGTAAILGYSPEAMMADGQLWSSRIPEADREHIIQPTAQAILTGETQHAIKYRFCRSDGAVIWIRELLTARWQLQEGCWMITAVATDISDCKQSELRLEQKARQETALADLVEAIQGLLDIEQIFELAVDRIADCLLSRVMILQYLPEEHCWRPQALSAYPDDWSEEQEAQSRADIDDRNNPLATRLKQQEILKFDNTDDLLTLNHPPTHELVYLWPGAWLLVPIVIQDQVWGSLTLIRPSPATPWSQDDVVLARRVANKVAIAIHQSNLYRELQTSNDRDELVLRGINEGIWDWDIITDRIQVSDRYWEILGYDPTEQGRFTSASQELDRIHPEDRSVYLDAEVQHTRFRHPFSQEVRMRHREGHYLWIRDRGQAFWDENGNPIRMVGSIEDISERKALEGRLRQQEEDFRTLVENNPDGILRIDRQFRFLYVNPIIESRTGISKAEFVGKTFAEIGMPEPLIQLWESAIAHVFETGQEQLLETEEVLSLGRHTFYSRIVPELDSHGNLISVLVISRDMTNLRAAQEALQQRADREHTLRLITQHIRESLELDVILSTAVNEVQRSLQADRALIFHLRSDRSGQIIAEAVLPEWPVTLEMRWEDEHFSAECYNFYAQDQGRIVPDITQDEWADCLTEFMQEIGVQSKMVAPIIQHLDDGPIVWGLIITHACATQRQWQTDELALLQQVADQLAIAIQQSELHQRLQAANQELERISTTDALTQIANRRHFDDIFAKEWLRAQREQRKLALVLCDIDYFKQYNDTYGHPAGDDCIAAVAQALQGCVNRVTDCLARYGGEEFAVILPHTDVTGAIVIVQNMQAAIAALNIEHQSHEFADVVTLSFGIAAMTPQPATDPQLLLNQADRALYTAKQSGRDRYAVATDSL